MSKPSSWTLEITGSSADPESEALILIRHDPLPQFRLEIHAPELANARGSAEIRLARVAIKEAVKALQAALDSPSALPGGLERIARQI